MLLLLLLSPPLPLLPLLLTPSPPIVCYLTDSKSSTNTTYDYNLLMINGGNTIICSFKIDGLLLLLLLLFYWFWCWSVVIFYSFSRESVVVTVYIEYWLVNMWYALSLLYIGLSSKWLSPLRLICYAEI